MNGNTRSTKSYRRGVRLGIYFKRLRDLLTKWDRLCVEAAKTHQVPAWLGHVPMYATMAVGISILAVTLFSLVSSSVLIIGIALCWWLLRGTSTALHAHADESNAERSWLSGKDGFYSSDEEDGYRNGVEGTGYYMGGFRVDKNNE